MGCTNYQWTLAGNTFYIISKHRGGDIHYLIVIFIIIDACCFIVSQREIALGRVFHHFRK